jgi:hypothetical protein
MFVNRVLRRIFGSRTDEVTGGWRKLHNKELHNLYASPSIIRMIQSRSIRWRGHVAQMGEERNAYKILVGKPEEKRTLRKPRHSCMYNIKLDLKRERMGWFGQLSSGSVYGPVVDSCEHGNKPSCYIKILGSS